MLTLLAVNLTFAGRHGSDVELLKYAYDFEQRTKRRIEPPVTPALKSNFVPTKYERTAEQSLTLEVDFAGRVSNNEVRLEGSVGTTSSSNIELEVRVDGKIVPAGQIEIEEGRWSVKTQFTPFSPPKATYGGYGEVVGNVVVVVLARCSGQVTGKLVLIDQTADIGKSN